MTLDHYNVLGIKRKASAEDIQHAYRNLAFQFHPDRNRAPEAAVRMVIINHAYEVLGDARRRKEYDERTSRAIPHNEMSSAILLAARDVVLRSGWRVVEDHGKNMLLESGKERVRMVLADRLDAALMNRASHEHSEFTVVCGVFVDPSMDSAALGRYPCTIGLDLMRGARYGELPDGACRSLLAAFL